MSKIRTANNFRNRVSSWSELSELIEHFSLFIGYDWLFRGVTDTTYDLKSKIGREKARALKLDSQTGERVRVPYRFEDEQAVLTMFEQQARAHVPGFPTTLEWLAIAQHHGLPTRLLDWTDSLLVAAWFAVEIGGAKTVDSAIWVTKGIPSIVDDFSVEVLTLAEPRTFRPPHINPRISAQGSVLMICPSPCNEVALPFSRKIVIAREAEFTIKKRLNACGINRRHLFPDLGGLSEHLKWIHRNDWLAGYRASIKPEPQSDTPNDAPDEAVD
jgi:hypothetical protein